MSSHLRIGACALIATGALALPAGANAADIQTAVSAVTAHTDRADSALDRAVAQFKGGSDRAARKAYATSRKEMGLAKAALGEARRQAVTPDEHAAAAAATAVLGTEQGQNIEKLAAALIPADGADENAIAAAARADTKGREKAIAILTALLAKIPEQAKPGILKAITALSLDRADETNVQVKALVSPKVSNTNKRRVALTIKTSVDGQNTASAKLAALIADPNMPAQSKPGLQIAYDNVTAEHGSVADILSRLSPRMPAFVRDFVTKIITQARTDARGMRENHPTGPPAGVPGGPTAGPSGGPGATVPAGPLAGIQFGPPSA
ncbi:MAG TPA: hypothetical protein VNA28_10950 [Solirubrobacteraceae bacterium]|nr:hypothetical protein [Solirubrobacteraceae bacterium]